MSTEILGLDEIISSQAGKEITHNTALRQLEGRLIRAKDKDLTTAPGSPANGDTYIVGTGAGGIWTGHDKKIAHFYGGAWTYWMPIEGVSLWLNDENTVYVYDGSAWTILTGPGGVGTVTSVGLSLPTELTISNSPVTGAGTLTGVWANKTANTVFAGPTTGGASTPAFRALVAADIPSLSGTYAPLSQPMIPSLFWPAVPTASQVLLLHKFAVATTFAASLAGWQGVSLVAATAETILNVQKNGSSIGSITFAISGTVPTFSGAGGSFAVGDILKIIAPGTPDTTLSGIAISAYGIR